MSEHMIEIIVEKRFNALDARFMAGEVTQATYDREAEAITLWADLHSLAAFERSISEVV